MNRILRGGDAFIEQVRARVPKEADLDEMPCIRRCPMAQPLSGYEATTKGDRDAAIAAVFRAGDYTMRQLAAHLDTDHSTVRRLVKQGEEGG